MNRARQIAALLCLSAWCLPAAVAQSGSLPQDRDLSRFGLTRAWWGQAAIDPRSAEVEFMTVDEDNVYIQTTNNVITALDAETGRRMWTTLLGLHGQQALPISTNETQALVAIGMELYAVDKFTGEIVWQLELPHHPSTSPGVDSDNVYIGMINGSVFAYDLRKIQRLHNEGRLPLWSNNAFVWRYQAPGAISSPPVSDGRAVTFASREGTVYSVATRERKTFFQFETDRGIRTPIGRGGSTIFVTSEDSRLFCLNATNGVRRWGFTAGLPIKNRPVVVSGYVYVTPQRDGMYRLNTTTGLIEPGVDGWHQPLATEFLAVSNQYLFASDATGNLLVLALQDGAVLDVLPLRHFAVRVGNERTDRLFLATSDGLVVCIREAAQEFPVYHMFPERRPILPELVPDEPSTPDPDAAAAN